MAVFCHMNPKVRTHGCGVKEKERLPLGRRSGWRGFLPAQENMASISEEDKELSVTVAVMATA